MGKKFKKFIATSIVVLAGTIFMSCGEKNYRVSFNLNGGSAVESQIILENGLVTAPANPTKTNAIFGGWFKDSACTTPWNFSEDKITADTVIFAKWIETKEIILPDTTLEEDGYKLSVVGDNPIIPLNSNYEIKLEINTTKFIIDDFSLVRNGSAVTAPETFEVLEGKRIYTYNFENISEDQEFSVLGLVPKFYIATFDASASYTITDIEGTRSSIDYGTDYSFKINLLEGYSNSGSTMIVRIGENILYPDSNGIYKIQNITANLAIKISNVYKNLYTISYPDSLVSEPRFEVVQDLNNVFHGETVSFKIKLADKYKKVKVDEVIDIKVAGVSVQAEHIFDQENSTYTFTIPANKVTGNINIYLNDTDWAVDKYIVSFPTEMVGYNLTSTYPSIENGKFEVPYNDEFSFKLELKEDYKYCQTFKVMVGDQNFTNSLYGTEDDIVRVAHITKDTEIKLENLTKNSFVIEVPEDAGYEVILADGYSLPVENGKDIKFDIRVLEELGYEKKFPDLPLPSYTLTYYDNPYTSIDESKETITSVDIYKNGYYTIPSVTGNIKLSVTGIGKRDFIAKVPTHEAYSVQNMPEKLTYGQIYTFDLIIADEYLTCLENSEIRANINGKVLSRKINLAEKKVTFTINVNNSLLSYLGKENELPISITGIYKDYYTVRFVLNSGSVTGATFKDYATLGEGYTENTYEIVVRRGESAVAPLMENIIAPNHYELNENRVWKQDFSNVEEDLIVYAEFIPVSYYITFDTRGGVNSPLNSSTGSAENYRYEYSIEKPINLAAPTKEIDENSGKYYDFLGWFLEKDGTEINILDFDGFENIQVYAKWGIVVGDDKERKTISEAVKLAKSGDLILVSESARFGNEKIEINNKELEISGFENAKIIIEDIENLSGNSTTGYYLFSVLGSNNFKFSGIDFELDNSIDSKVYAFHIVDSNTEIKDSNINGLSLMRAYSNDDKKILVDGVSVLNNKNIYAISSFAKTGTSRIEIINSTFKTFKGIYIGKTETATGNQTIKIEDNVFEKVELIEDIENEISNDIEIVGVHEVLAISNSHKNEIEDSKYIVIENGLDNILVKEEIEELISKISIDLEGESPVIPIEIYSMEEIIVGTDDAGGPIVEVKKTNEILYNFENQIKLVTIHYGLQNAIISALEFADKLVLDLEEIIYIGSEIIIPENVEVDIISRDLVIETNGKLIINGILNFNGNIKNLGVIEVGANGELNNLTAVKIGTSYDVGNNTSKLSLEESENAPMKIKGEVIKASKDSLVYSYFENAVNKTGYFVSFQVYAGIETAGTEINDIVITNENGLIYNTGTHTSNQLTDTVNEFGYIDVIIDANVLDGVANLSKVEISFGGKSYEIDMELTPYLPEVLADESFAMAYIYGTYLNNGVGTAYIFNTYQTISQNEDNSIVSDKDNFSKLIASGAVAKARSDSNISKIAPESSSDHYITFRQYVGIQYAGRYIAESYVIDGVPTSEVANIHVLGQRSNNKNKVDDEGYLHYIFDAKVTYTNLNGVALYEKVNLKTVQVFFSLDGATYEIRVDLQNMLVYNRSTGMNVMLGNTIDLGIENRLNILTYRDGKYNLSGEVYKVGETEKIKENETFYNGDYTASGYFASYRIFVDPTAEYKKHIGKTVSVSVTGYEGKTWNNGKVQANGYLDLITELILDGSSIKNGELNITYQIEGEEEQTIILVLNDLVVREDKASLQYAVKSEDFEVNGAGTGVNFNTYEITPIEEGSYKIVSGFFDKVGEDSVAYDNPYAKENSSGYFVAVTAFAGVRSWGDKVAVELKYYKDSNEVDSETRNLEVSLNGYVGLFIDTMVTANELGFDNLEIKIKNVDNEYITYNIDFSEVVVGVYESE